MSADWKEPGKRFSKNGKASRFSVYFCKNFGLITVHCVYSIPMPEMLLSLFCSDILLTNKIGVKPDYLQLKPECQKPAKGVILC